MKLHVKGAWRECQVMPAPQGTFAITDRFGLVTPVFLFIAEPIIELNGYDSLIEGCLIDGTARECVYIANLFESCHVHWLMDKLKSDSDEDKLAEIDYTLNLLKERKINISDEARVQFRSITNKLKQAIENTKDEN